MAENITILFFYFSARSRYARDSRQVLVLSRLGSHDDGPRLSATYVFTRRETAEKKGC